MSNDTEFKSRPLQVGIVPLLLSAVASLAYVTSRDVFPYCGEEGREPDPRCTVGAIVLEKHGLPFKVGTHACQQGASI